MKLLFWISVSLIIYTFIGYPILLSVRARFFAKPVAKASITPPITIIVAVRNGVHLIGRKLDNLFSLQWPMDALEIIVVSDGSVDGTDEKLLKRSLNDPRLQVFSIPQSGKAEAINFAVGKAKNEFLVLTDVRQLLEPEAVRSMIANFADPQVGGVSGTLLLGKLNAQTTISGEAIKWEIENRIREWEGASGSVVGTLGAFSGVRKELFTEIPRRFLLDDMWVPLHVVKKGYRVVFERKARAWDDVAPTRRQEFLRKVRTLTGNFELLRVAPWLLTPTYPLFFEFMSHKLFRLISPFALASALISAALIPMPLYRFALAMQLVFYSLAILPLTSFTPRIIARYSDAANTFVMLNLAVVVALRNFIAGKTDVWMG